MLTNLSATSAALSLGTRINIPTGTLRFPVLSALPVAYWVAGDTGIKQTSSVSWDKKYIDIEELAVIVPLPDSVYEDSGFDVWASIQPLLEGAIARAFDEAVFLGINAPGSFPVNLAAAATAAGNVVQAGTAAEEDGGLAADISDLMTTLDDDGYMADGGVAKTSLRGAVRRMSATPLLNRPGAVLTPDDWYGVPITYPMRGLWGTAAAAPEAIIGDFTNLVVGVRRDFTYKMLTESVITDNTGAIIYNLAQQDMTAMRLTFRAGYQVSNPINYDQPNAAARYPFAVLSHA